MFDKFLKRVEKFSDLAKNSKVLAEKVEPTNIVNHHHNEGNGNYQRNNFSGNSNYGNKKNNFKQNTFKKEYHDDGSYFCSYATGGNTLVCYKNNEKLEINLAGIEHPDKNHFLAKRANYFLNDLVKKKKLILKDIGNNLFEAFLIDNLNQSINQLMIEEGFHSSVPYAEKTEKAKPFEKFKNNNDEKKSVTDDTDSSIDKKVSEKNKEQKTRNFAYGLFAKDAETFEAMFNNKKITCKINELDISCFSNETKKKIKNIIYEFVSKKSIILDIKKEDDEIFYVVVTNKTGENLNEIISSKNFPKEDVKVENPIIDKLEDSQLSTTLDVTTEDDWNWVNDDITSNEDSSSKNNKVVDDETDIPEVSNIPKMFQNKPKSDSPFSRIKKGNTETNDNNLSDDSNTSVKNKLSFSK